MVEKNISFEDFTSVDENLAIINEVMDLNIDQGENSDDQYHPVLKLTKVYNCLDVFSKVRKTLIEIYLIAGIY